MPHLNVLTEGIYCAKFQACALRVVAELKHGIYQLLLLMICYHGNTKQKQHTRHMMKIQDAYMPHFPPLKKVYAITRNLQLARWLIHSSLQLDLPRLRRRAISGGTQENAHLMRWEIR